MKTRKKNTKEINAIQIILGSIIFFGSIILLNFNQQRKTYASSDTKTLWKIQSIDTMKYSRDLAREKVTDPNFDRIIDTQVKQIKETGANYVSIGTPYDEEFFPYLKKWVDAARKYDLKIWFRGNFAGWEGWFGYNKITPDEHKIKLESFLNAHPSIFEDGDIFTSCTECENGAIGDPRNTRDIDGYRKFLIDESQIIKNFSTKIKINISGNFYPSNGDVARLIWDKETTKKLGGVVVVDHYVKTPEKLNADITEIANNSGGMVVLGEWGAPIPDIHGNLNEKEQSQWIATALNLLSHQKNLLGLNYWTGVGGTTNLWAEDGTKKLAQTDLQNYYLSYKAQVVVVNELNEKIDNAKLIADHSQSETDRYGNGEISLFAKDKKLIVNAGGYFENSIDINKEISEYKIELVKENPSLIYQIRKAFKLFIDKFSK